MRHFFTLFYFTVVLANFSEVHVFLKNLLKTKLFNQLNLIWAWFLSFY